jgi:PPP family 3-phenylpropionic acid transporter
MKQQKFALFSSEFLAYALLACMTLLSQYFVYIGLPPSFVGILMALPSLNALWANQFYFLLAYKFGLKRVVLYSATVGIVSMWILFASKRVFMIFFFCFLLMLSQGGLVPLLESSLVELASRTKLSYGKIRLFGTFGYAVASYLVANLVNEGFVALFIVYSVLFFLIASVVRRSKLEMDFHQRPSLRVIDKRFSVLFAIVTVAVGLNLFNSVFLPVLVKSKNFHAASVGLSFTLMALSETPFLLFAERIVKRFGSFRLLSSAIFVVGLRLVIASFATTETQLLLIQLLHGWTYIVIYYATLFLMRQKLSAHVLEATQILFWISLQGIGPLLGSTVGGVVVEKVGVELAYLMFGIIAMSLVIFSWAVEKIWFRRGEGT